MPTPSQTQAAAGTRFGIAAGVPATWDAAGFVAQTFQNIGKIKNGGEIGATYEVIKNNYLTQRGTEKRKGTFDAGQLTLELDKMTEAGQTLCKTALDTDADYSFCITLQDGSGFYLRGIVTKFTTKISGPNDMVSGTVSVEVNPIFLAGGDEVASIEFAAP